MKIRDDNGLSKGIQPHLRTVQPSRSDSKAEGSAVGKPAGDRVELSDQARALFAAKDALSQLPEVRQDKVNILKEQVKAKKYDVPAADLAVQMLAEGLFA